MLRSVVFSCDFTSAYAHNNSHWTLYSSLSYSIKSKKQGYLVDRWKLKKRNEPRRQSTYRIADRREQYERRGGVIVEDFINCSLRLLHLLQYRLWMEAGFMSSIFYGSAVSQRNYYKNLPASICALLDQSAMRLTEDGLLQNGNHAKKRLLEKRPQPVYSYVRHYSHT